MGKIAYNKIAAYKISAETIAPLHIGGYLGDKDEILIHSTTGYPFIQASTLAGVMRNICSKVNDHDITNNLFGEDRFKENQNSNEVKSRIIVSDGIFVDDTVIFEKRPGVAIDRKTGSVYSLSGINKKYEISYISTGAKFSFTVYLYMSSDDELLQLEKVFSVIKDGDIGIGAKKSSGSGKFRINEIGRITFDMTNETERNSWIRFDGRNEQGEYIDIKNKLPSIEGVVLYDIKIKAKTEGPLQVKGIDVEDFHINAPDSENMQNGRKEFIIPGTSFRGTIRNQMERIAAYLHKEKVIDNAFGLVAKNHSDSRSGNLIFNDTIFENTEGIRSNPIRHRVHIDSQGFFSERNANGVLEFRIQIKDRYNPESTLGLLVYALRDLALKTFNLGNGYATGKGFLDIEEITILKADDNKAVISFNEGQGFLQDDNGLIEKAIKSLSEEA